MDEKLTDEAVRLAYKFFLGRAAENDEMLRFALAYGTVGKLRDAFLNSREFEHILNLKPRLVPAGARPMPVESQTDDAGVRAMLAELRATWDRVPPPGWDGARQAADVMACLDRNGLARPREAFELGCGAGRVTRHLAALAPLLTACDASPVQLTAAQNIPGITLRVADDATFGMSEPFDLFYSYHALHYGPPPLAARALARAFAMLRPGGAAVFQLVTYGMGYSYAAAEAHRPRHPDPYEERQVLPQPVVFGLARDAGCDVVEAFDDASVAPSALWRSSIFVLRKPAT